MYCEMAVQSPSHRLLPYTEFCALLIQRWWRSLAKPHYPRPPPPTTDGALSVAASTGLSSAGKSGGETPGMKRGFDREEASKVIQRAWRRHIVRITNSFLFKQYLFFTIIYSRSYVLIEGAYVTLIRQ